MKSPVGSRLGVTVRAIFDSIGTQICYKHGPSGGCDDTHAGTNAACVADPCLARGPGAMRHHFWAGAGADLLWFRHSAVLAARLCAATGLLSAVLRAAGVLPTTRQHVQLCAAVGTTAEPGAAARLPAARRLFAIRRLHSVDGRRAVAGRRANLPGWCLCLPAGGGHAAGWRLLLPRT